MRGAHLPRRSPRARSARPRSRAPCTARPTPDAGCRDHRHRPRPLLDHLQQRPRRRHAPRWRRSPSSAPRPPTCGFKYFLEVFNPNVDTGIDPEVLPHYINDSILRCLAGVHQADRPQFLKIVYNGPKALEELTSFDPSLIVGVLGGGAGTTRDCFELLHQAEKYGARVALFGRKINLAEAPLAIVAMMREVVDGNLSPQEAVRAYHGELQKQRIKPLAPARGRHGDHRGRAPAAAVTPAAGSSAAAASCVDVNKVIDRLPPPEELARHPVRDRRHGRPRPQHGGRPRPARLRLPAAAGRAGRRRRAWPAGARYLRRRSASTRPASASCRACRPPTPT